jgi:hypothetical protein
MVAFVACGSEPTAGEAECRREGSGEVERSGEGGSDGFHPITIKRFASAAAVISATNVSSL